MKKIKITMIMLACILFLLTACNSKDKGNGIKNEKVSRFPVKYERTTKNLKFRTDIIIDKEAKDLLYRSEAIKLNFSIPKIVQAQFNKTDDGSIHKVNEDSYVSSSGKSLYIYKDYLAFNSNSELESRVSSSFSLDQKSFTADKFSQITNFTPPFLSEENKIIKYLSDLGMHNVQLYKHYTLDHKTLQENEQHRNKYGHIVKDGNKEKWTEKDNCSYWLGYEKWQGLPVFCSSFATGLSDSWAPIQVLNTDNGMEKIQVLYYYNFKRGNKQVKLLPFDQVAKALDKEYSMLLGSNKRDVTKAELAFWIDVNQMQHTFQMKPVWVFTLHEYKEGKEDVYREYQEMINAETAESVEVGG